jgi:polysaccharide pyruvyl transferase WcaK-like protein
MALGVQRYRQSRTVFPILVGMEMLDSDACRQIAERIGGAPFFSSERLTMYELVSILRQSSSMLSSRFHAIVTSMPAGVPSVGVTMDERIRNLMRDRGHEHLLMNVDDPDLADRIVAALSALDAGREEIQEAMGRTVTRNLHTMARMGVYFEERVARQYPEFPVYTGVRSWEEYLPPLSPLLCSLFERHTEALAS